MILVPYARWEIETSLSPPALAGRAREFLADEPPAEVHPDITDVLERGGARYQGAVDNSGFRLRAQAKNRMGYLPVIRGVAAERSGGTRLSLSVHVSLTEAIVVVAFVSAIAFMSRSLWVAGVFACAYHFPAYAFGFAPHRNTIRSWSEKLPR